MIRLTIPSIEDDDLRAVQEVLLSGLLVQGAHVSDFERLVAEYVGTKHAIAVSNGTAALHLALLALRVELGDIVIVTAYSWPATANVIELCGAQPVFVDIQPGTFNMDPVALEEVLRPLMSLDETARKVKAILPVHAFGQVADMEAIMKLADHYGIPVVEDAACALGASIDSKQAGLWGTMGCFSFHPRKAVTTGEGGVIVTDDPALNRALRALRNHGQDPEASSPDFIMPGYNYRMTEFQAALGSTQMSKVDSIIHSRRQKAQIYDRLLKNSVITAPQVSSTSKHIYQSYVTLLEGMTAETRNQIVQQLRQEGIETTIGTWHMPLTSYYRTKYGFKPTDFPVTDKVFAQSLSLPLHPYLSQQDQERIIEALLVKIVDQGSSS